MAQIKHLKNISIVLFLLHLSKNFCCLVFLFINKFNKQQFRSSPTNSSHVLINNADCFPRDYSVNYTRANKTITVVGEGDFHSCAKHLVTLLNLNATCKRKPCSVNGVYQPDINYEAQDFYGFSEFWYAMEG